MNPSTIEWQCKPLGDICSIVGGGTPSKKNEAFFQGNIPWATVRDMNQNIITETSFKITEDAVNNSSTNIIKAGNVVIATRVGLGKVCLIDQDTAINQDLRGIIPKKKDAISVLFLFWWLKSIAHIIEQEGTGATVKGVKLPFVKSLRVPLPPLPEQKRIVSILDEVFKGIGKAVANVERNLVNSRELFESYLNGVFSKAKIGWWEKSFGDPDLLSIVDGDRGKNYPKKADFHEKGFCLFLNTKNVRPDGFRFDTKMFITKDKDSLLRKGKLHRRDVILTTRGTIGNIALYDDEVPYDHVRINSGMLILRPNESLITSEYLFEMLRSSIIRQQIKEHTSGAAQPQLPIKTLVHFTLPVPKKIQEQNKIVKRINKFSHFTKELEISYQKKLNTLTELKQSILQKAFTGELTAKNVDKTMEPV